MDPMREIPMNPPMRGHPMRGIPHLDQGDPPGDGETPLDIPDPRQHPKRDRMKVEVDRRSETIL